VAQALHVLSVLLKFVILLSLVFVAFGPNYSHLLLRMLYGATWSETNAPNVLALYCVYLLFIAINGLTEALLFALLTAESLSKYNRVLLLFSCGYVGACVVCLPRFGGIGLILANCFNMSMRVVYSSRQIYKTMQRDEPTASFSSLARGCLPSRGVLVLYVAAYAVTWATKTWVYAPAVAASWTKAYLVASAAHVGVGAGMLALLVAAVWKAERAFIGKFKQLWSSKHKRA
jgi:oligosaccharide translocation protein RFT1